MVNNELKINHNYQAVIGDFPKVGIRPTIDGRMRGVRESLEEQTMNMGWETQVALNCLGNPGIYLHTDDDTFWVMDHVDAQVVKRDKTRVMLKITNPTSYDAKVSIMAETAEQAQKPLLVNAFNKWPKVEVKAGMIRVVTIAIDGHIKP